jgi:hypothetical protein
VWIGDDDNTGTKDSECASLRSSQVLSKCMLFGGDVFDDVSSG